MRIALGLLLALVLAAPAWAQSVTFGTKLIVVGDSVAKVFEVAGEPDRVLPLESTYGDVLVGIVAERFEYYRGGKTISITVQDGRVIDVREMD